MGTLVTDVTSPLRTCSVAACPPRKSTSKCSTSKTRTPPTSSSGSRTTSSPPSVTFPPRGSRCPPPHRKLYRYPRNVQAHFRAVHLYVPTQGVPSLVHRRRYGRDGVHGGRIQHERPRVRVPAVPRCHRRRGWRVRRRRHG